MKPKLSVTQLSPWLHKQRVLLQRRLSLLWETKDLKHVGFLICHYVGFVGYIFFTLVACFTLGLLLFMLDFFLNNLLTTGLFAKKEKGETIIPGAAPSLFPMHNLFHWLLQVLLWLLLGIFRIFAGFMGWGAKDTRPGSMIIIMLQSIPSHFHPNVRTAWWSVPTIAAPIVSFLYVLSTLQTGQV